MREKVEALVSQVGQIIVGKEEAIRLAVVCVLARGHLLIEDVPGVGKTTLSHALARSLGLDFRRIQFTSDLLPADIVGNSIFNRDSQRFEFHEGPLFSPVVLIDEVNRATPKTQSALLESMEEGQVTVDGVTHPLPDPFLVVATQNPQQQLGTFPLPESQLDRFLMRISIGVPDRKSEREMLLGRERREMLRGLEPVVSVEELRECQRQVRELHASSALLDYLQDLIEESRRRHKVGLSPRAGLALLSAAKGWGWMQGREMVIPEDLQQVGRPVMGHRLGTDLEMGETSGQGLASSLLQTVAVP